MAQIGKGMFAGFVATLVLSAFMIMKQMMGMMPDLNVIKMLADMSGAPSLLAGWLMHFFIGTAVWGTAFAVLQPRIPGGSTVVRGIMFGIAAWLLMMIMVMPMAGAGLFGLRFGLAAPVMTLLLHIVFGATLGAVYAWRGATAPA